MFTKALVLLCLCSCAYKAFSQPITWIQGARTAALANADAALQDPWNTVGNPAGIAACTSPTLSFGMERRFLVKGLDTKAATAVLPFRKHVFGLNINFFGSPLYNEHLISVSYGRALSEKFRAGFRINYHGLKIAESPLHQAWSVTAGIQVSPVPRLTLGAAVSNPNGAAFSGQLYAKIPVIIELGGAFAFSDKVLGTLELKRVSGFPFAVHTGFEYVLHSTIAIRAGIATSPFRQYGGLGLRCKSLSLNLSASSHLQLGFTPQISLSYVF